MSDNAPATAGYAGQKNFPDGNSWANTLNFAMEMFTGKMWTATLVQVVKTYPAAEAALTLPVGIVDVTPLVNMQDAQGYSTVHGTIFGLPYFRAQGGASAIILDPVLNDIGIAVFASRDISAVKRTKQRSNPASYRRFNASDGLYIGGFLNGAPTQFIEFLAGGGIKVTTPGNLVVSAANCTLDAAGNLTVKGNVTADDGASHVDLVNHTHGGVQSGGSNTAAPNPGT